MGFLTDQASMRGTKYRRAYVPEWFGAAQVAGLVVLGVFLAFLLIKAATVSEDPTNIANGIGVGGLQPNGIAPPAPAASDPAEPAPTEPTVEPSPAATEAPAGALTLPDTTLPGQEIQVPLEAAEVARQGALALFTGNFAPVPLASFYVAPAPGTLNLSPQATAGAVVSASTGGEDKLIVVVQIDIDGAGPQPVRPIPARVALESGSWGFYQVVG